MWQKNGIPFKNPLRWNDRQIWNPTDEQLTKAGYTEVPDPKPDYAELRAAFAKFREVCGQIGELIGDPDFRGGTLEDDSALERPEAQTTVGLALGQRLTLAERACTIAAGKLGIGSPDWWYMCWEPEK